MIRTYLAGVTLLAAALVAAPAASAQSMGGGVTDQRFPPSENTNVFGVPAGGEDVRRTPAPGTDIVPLDPRHSGGPVGTAAEVEAQLRGNRRGPYDPDFHLERLQGSGGLSAAQSAQIPRARQEVVYDAMNGGGGGGGGGLCGGAKGIMGFLCGVASFFGG